MIDITAELEGVRTEQWGSKLQEYLADGMGKLANQAAESEIITTIRGEVTELKTKAEEAYNTAASAKTDATAANEKVENIKTTVSTMQEKIIVLEETTTGGVSQGNIALYVNAETGSDEQDGSQSAPLKTLERALNLSKKYRYTGIYLTSGQTFTTGSFTPGWEFYQISNQVISIRSTEIENPAKIDSELTIGTGAICSLWGVIVTGMTHIANSNAIIHNCTLDNLYIEENSNVSMLDSTIRGVLSYFSNVRLAGCTVTEKADAERCCIIYTDSQTTIAKKVAESGGAFYKDGIYETV